MLPSKKKKKILALTQELGVKYINDFIMLYKYILAVLLKNSLDAELEEELDYSKYDYKNKITNAGL